MADVSPNAPPSSAASAHGSGMSRISSYPVTSSNTNSQMSTAPSFESKVNQSQDKSYLDGE
jgi:hypothetical protein